MIIIIEGENKCGKSTLANYICDKYEFNYIKCSQPKEDPYIEYMKILQQINTNTVIDRFHLGEFVYGPIYRGRSDLDEKKFINIEMLALAKRANIIYCYDEIINIQERFKTENEDFAKTELVETAQILYNDILERSILPIHFHQMKTENDLIKTKNIDKIINKNDEFYLPNIIGNTKNPKLIIVGDRCNFNHKIHKRYINIQQVFDFGPSSNFLFKKLKEVSIKLQDIAILNCDNKFLLNFIKDKHAKIISLGANAHQELNKLSVKNIKLNHPNYENRFFYHNSDFHIKLKKIYEQL